MGSVITPNRPYRNVPMHPNLSFAIRYYDNTLSLILCTTLYKTFCFADALEECTLSYLKNAMLTAELSNSICIFMQ